MLVEVDRQPLELTVRHCSSCIKGTRVFNEEGFLPCVDLEYLITSMPSNYMRQGRLSQTGRPGQE